MTTPSKNFTPCLQTDHAVVNNEPAAEQIVARKRPRGRRILLGMVLLLTGTATICLVYDSIVAENHLRNAIAETDRVDPGWRLDDILKNQEKIPDPDNGALRRIAVKRMLPARWMTPATNLGQVQPPAQLSPEQTGALRARLQELNKGVAAARELVSAPRGSEPFTWNGKTTVSTFPPVTEALEVAKLLSCDAALLGQDSQLDRAVGSCRAIVATSRTLGEGPDLMRSLVRQAIDSIAQAALKRVLSQGEATEPALAELQHDLEDEAAQPFFLIGLRGERASTDEQFEAIQKGEMKFSEFVRASSPTWMRLNGYAPEDFYFPIRFGSIKRSRAYVLENLTRIIETFKLPARQRVRRLDELNEQIKALPTLARERLSIYLKYCRDMEKDALLLREAVAAIAAERYRLANGSWPRALKDLVPRYLASVPEDPFSDDTLGLRRLDDSVVIHSDSSGGKTITSFRLWDVKERRQPSPAGNASKNRMN